ncbi:PBECR4 domain-containing protein [Chakrabartyella piscis]|uniref:PBECR4 domain-containing protein n=1 Tax=Chakrabartyella piscis TaxID=2918914 RepID=UPI0029589F0E|nr:PBECR4 domain-containing protein [Chakrabartyella piscis]
MDKILECASNYKKLTNVRYNMVIGRKGKAVKIVLDFDESNFHHLLGLHKLTDLVGIASGNRKKIFNQILGKSITAAQIQKSDFFDKLESRIDPLCNLEKLLDTNEIVFRYNEKLHTFSVIKADFLLSTPLNNRDTYIFLSNEKDDNYFCRSLFYETNIDYTSRQPKYTLLYKEKINISTGETEVQYDRLKK